MRTLIRKTILLVLLLASSTVFGSERIVLISTPPGSGSDDDLTSQLAGWAALGVISKVELFESEPEEEAQFQLFGILRFSDAQALHNWNALADKALQPTVERTEVDLLAQLGASPFASSGSVFQVMQYDVMINRTQFEGYIEGYQLPEMRERESHGGLTRYTSFYAVPGSTAPWQSLIIMEYKNVQAYQESKVLNKKLGEQLALKDLRFSELKKKKHSLRNKTATTRAHWLALPMTSENGKSSQ